MNTSSTLIFLFALSVGLVHPKPLETMRAKNHHIHVRIIGGDDVQRFQYPWQVSLQMLHNEGHWEHFCGGTIINHNQILTAAHCFYKRDLTNVRVVLGAHNIKNKEEFGQQITGVVDARIHPRFNLNSMTNDVAVITLDQVVEFNDQVRAIPLASEEDNPEGQSCVSTGWGNTNMGSAFIAPEVLQAVRLTVISNEVCSRKLESFLDVDQTMMCAHDFSGGKGSCTGDSGGPLVCVNSNGPYVAGVVSWGVVPCGGADHPSVFAKVKHFSSFILNEDTSPSLK